MNSKSTWYSCGRTNCSNSSMYPMDCLMDPEFSRNCFLDFAVWTPIWLSRHWAWLRGGYCRYRSLIDWLIDWTSLSPSILNWREKDTLMLPTSINLTCSRLYVSFASGDTAAALNGLQLFLASVQSWKLVIKMKLNPDKTELLPIRNDWQRSRYLSMFPIELFGVKTILAKSACK